MNYFMLTYNVIVDNKQRYFGQAVLAAEQMSNNIDDLRKFHSIVKEGYLKSFPTATSIIIIIKEIEIVSFQQYLEFVEEARALNN